MDIKSNLNFLRLQGYKLIPEKSNLLKRTLARIPLFFVAVAAALNEAILGLKGLFFKASPISSHANSTTYKTSLVSAELFSLLWKLPDPRKRLEAELYTMNIPVDIDTHSAEGLILEAQLAHAMARLPMMNTQAPRHIDLKFGEVLGFEKEFRTQDTIKLLEKDLLKLRSLDKKINFEDFILNKSTYAEPHELSFLKERICHIEDPFDPRISKQDIDRAKDYLIHNFGGPYISSEIIAATKDLGIKTILSKLLAADLVSIKFLEKDLEQQIDALKAYKSFLEERKISECLSVDSIDSFETASSHKGSRASSLESVESADSDITLASEGEFAQTNKSHIAILRSILKERILNQFIADCNRSQISLTLPGVELPSYDDFSTRLPRENFDAGRVVYARMYYDALANFVKSGSETLDYPSFKKVLSYLFLLTQTTEGITGTKERSKNIQALRELMSKYGFQADGDFLEKITPSGITRIPPALCVNDPSFKKSIYRNLVAENGHLKIKASFDFMLVTYIDRNETIEAFKMPYHLSQEISIDKGIKITLQTDNIKWDRVELAPPTTH